MYCPQCGKSMVDGAEECTGSAPGAVLSPPAAGDADFGGQVASAVSLWKAHLGDLAV